MATTKLSALTALTTTDGAEELLINDGGTSKKVTIANLLVDDQVTAAKLANSINTEIAANTAKVTNATHTGDVTGATSLTIAVDAVDIAMLSATGTASSTTFLRGDNTWVVPTDTNTVYTHPNHSGEVTSTADGATVIADNIVDEANLKVSNSPTNGQFLSAQSGNTGGLTWAAVASDPSMGGDLSGTASNAQIVANAVGTTEIANSAVTDAKISGMSSSKLSGALPAIDGSSLTGLGGGFSSGTSMVFYQASAPTGWTKSTSNDNKALRVVSGSGGGTGGSWALSSGDTSSSDGAHTHSTPAHSHSHSLSAGAHTLSTSEMPSHTHTEEGYAHSKYNYPPSSGDVISWGVGFSSQNTGSAGSGSSHSHSLSGSISSGGSGTSGSSGAHTHTIGAPQYIDVIVCSKD